MTAILANNAEQVPNRSPLEESVLRAIHGLRDVVGDGYDEGERVQEIRRDLLAAMVLGDGAGGSGGDRGGEVKS